MIKVSDYIVKRLAEYGVKHVFMISGGGSMHLNDSFGKSKDIEYLCNHHEQACAMAAEGYARISGNLGVVCVTSGPGGTNCLTGVLGQWTDSVPVLYISGQVRQATMGAGWNGLRQLGDQEINIIDIVRPITKFSDTVRKPEDIGYLLYKAIQIATTGRPGPVWLDVPLDIQEALVDEDRIPGCELVNLKRIIGEDLPQLIRILQEADRPVLLAGHGIRIAGAQGLLLHVAETLGLPIVTSMNGMDLVPSDHPLFAGRAGTIGTRGGNWTLQNADVIVSIGTRNNIRQIGYDWKNFAPNATKIVVDVDSAELKKPTIKPDLAIRADAGRFLSKLAEEIELTYFPKWEGWRKECRSNEAVTPAQAYPEDGANPYAFIRTLTGLLPEDAVVVSGNGTASVALYQSGKVKKGQRIIMNSGCAAMGYDLPAAIGACLANGKKDVICITGDGSIQMNIQELQTIAHYNLPIKIFVLNNGGYKSIRMTQDNYFAGRHVGADMESGVSCSDIRKIAAAYGIEEYFIKCHESLPAVLLDVLNTPGPVICDVHLASDYTFNKIDIKNLCLTRRHARPGSS